MAESAHLDAAADSHDRWLLLSRGDGDGKHLVLQTIVLPIIHNKVENVGDWLVLGFKGCNIPVCQDYVSDIISNLLKTQIFPM